MEKKFYLNIPVFIIAFIGGLIYVYITLPKPKAIIKYPTPYNFNKYTYKGLSDDCYKFKAREVKCVSKTLPQPII